MALKWVCCNYCDTVLEYWHWRADAKGSDTPSTSAVVMDAEKIKPSVFLLVGTRKASGP